MRFRDEFSADERAVIYARNTGWEAVSPRALAQIFDTTPAEIRAILKSEHTRLSASGGSDDGNDPT